MKVVSIKLCFASADDERRHCLKHRRTMKALSCADYVRMASRFLTQELAPSVLECHRSDSDRLRYDSKTEEFGIASADGFIRTYFKPDPAIHGLSSNEAYFQFECAEGRDG